MATGWVKSWQCRSRALEDVYHPNAKILLPGASCGKGVRGLNDVVQTAKPKHSKHRQQPPPPPISKPKSQTASSPTEKVNKRCASGRPCKSPDPFFPTLSELPEGHPSRNVVEIIFHTRWGTKPFSGRIELVFKIQNMPKTVARFEEYREAVKSRSGPGLDDGCKYSGSARCVADGNEMMRFHCLGGTSALMEGCGGICAISGGGKGSTAGMCTFSGSGGAHESAGGGRGRRAMLVCRVIAGRVSERNGLDSFLDTRVGFDSLSAGGGHGELLAFDSRAVLPCFLIIYKL